MRELALPCPPHVFDEPAARDERRRPLPVVPQHVRLEVRLDPAETLVRGRVVHTVRARHDGLETLPLDAADMTIQSVEVGDTKARFTAHAAGLDVHLPRPLAAGEEVTFAVVYEARPTLGLFFMRPDALHPERRPQIWTQGAMEDHHHWFPCFDQPHALVTTEVEATVPEGFFALSNGEPAAFNVRAGRGRRRFHWKHETPHALYLLTLVVDQVVEVADRRGPVPLFHYVPKGRESDARTLFERMPQMMTFFAGLTGRPYPYPRYGHTFLQAFMWGGMENTTLTSLTDTILVAGEHRHQEDVERLFAHELAHQWFGDLIAPRGWTHIWLNESFATYAEILCMEALDGPEDFARRLQIERDGYFEEARTRYARPVVTRRFAHPYVLFDRHAYEKGCLVLHTLRDQIGDEAFFRGLRAYVRDMAGRAAETADLRRTFEDASGEDLTDFFEQFVEGDAHAKVQVRWTWDRRAGLEVTLTRTDEGAQTLLLTLAAGDHRWRVRLAPGTRVLAVPLGSPPAWVALDPDQHCLVEIDEDAETDAALRARFANGPVALRMRTARVLARRGAEANTAALAAALAGDAAEPVRQEAARALGEHRSDAARAALLRAVTDDASFRVSAAAADALGTGGDPALVETLAALLRAEGRHRVRCALLAALGKIRTEAARQVIQAHLDDVSPRDSVAAAALGALAAHETADTLDLFVERVEHGRTDGLRAAAIGGLARVARALDDKARKRQARERLEAWLRHPDFKVRQAAIRALGDLRDPAARDALERAHGAEVFAFLRRAIREALGLLEEKK